MVIFSFARVIVSLWYLAKLSWSKLIQDDWKVTPILISKVWGFKLAKLLFQQDGAPAHYGCLEREWLNEKFGERWIGRRGFIEWQPRSPDLSPCDFLLWGVLKDRV